MRSTLLLGILMVFSLQAAEIGEAAAEAAARFRVNTDGNSTSHSIEGCVPLCGSDGETVLAFVFLLDPAGYVVTSADDRITPVIAYSYVNEPAPGETSSGPLLELVRADIQYRIEHLEETPEWFLERNRTLWAAMAEVPAASGPLPEQWPPAGSTPTEGWLEENWSQGAPYNSYCPMDLVAGQRSVAGCPAVAMGAILNFHMETNGTRFDDGDDYYHNYHEYYWIDDDHEAHDFPSWPELNGLLDTLEAHYAGGTITTDDRAAVVYASGAACKQVYTASVSGTFGVEQAYDAYVRFGFGDCQLLYETADSLMQILAGNMMDAMPVHLAIIDEVPQYGHNVVVDGYNTDDYFHINFGWGGASNGWYSFPLSGMPYGMNFIEGVIVDIGEPVQSTGHQGGTSCNVGIEAVTNPASATISATLSSPFSCSCRLQVYSVDGRLVISAPGELEEGSTSVCIPAHRLPPGVYVLRVVTDSSADAVLFTLSR